MMADITNDLFGVWKTSPDASPEIRNIAKLAAYEITKLRGVIWRNCDQSTANHEDARIISEIEKMFEQR